MERQKDRGRSLTPSQNRPWVGVGVGELLSKRGSCRSFGLEECLHGCACDPQGHSMNSMVTSPAYLVDGTISG